MLLVRWRTTRRERIKSYTQKRAKLPGGLARFGCIDAYLDAAALDDAVLDPDEAAFEELSPGLAGGSPLGAPSGAPCDDAETSTTIGSPVWAVPFSYALPLT